MGYHLSLYDSFIPQRTLIQENLILSNLLPWERSPPSLFYTRADSDSSETTLHSVYTRGLNECYSTWKPSPDSRPRQSAVGTHGDPAREQYCHKVHFLQKEIDFGGTFVVSVENKNIRIGLLPLLFFSRRICSFFLRSVFSESLQALLSSQFLSLFPGRCSVMLAS